MPRFKTAILAIGKVATFQVLALLVGFVSFKYVDVFSSLLVEAMAKITTNPVFIFPLVVLWFTYFAVQRTSLLFYKVAFFARWVLVFVTIPVVSMLNGLTMGLVISYLLGADAPGYELFGNGFGAVLASLINIVGAFYLLVFVCSYRFVMEIKNGC